MFSRTFKVVPLLLAVCVSSGAAANVDALSALKSYYASLEDKIADYSQYDIPFAFESIDVVRNDSLMKIANELRFDEIDSLHLAAALFEKNRGAFRNNDPGNLIDGARLDLPTVGELYLARYAYERVSIDSRGLSFDGSENQMRQGARLPFDVRQRKVMRQVQERALKTIEQAEIIGTGVATGEAMQTARVTWNVSLWGKRRAFTEHIEKLSELVYEKTDGEFLIELNYGGLAKPRENLEGISNDAFEMAQFCAGYHQEKNPSITVLELPFLGVESLEQERTISQWLYRHPAVLKDFRRWNAVALMPSPLPQYNLAGVGRTPRSLWDLDGLSVRATGGIGKAMRAANAVPVSTVASEVREAFDNGEISAAAFAPHAHMAFGTIDTATWWTTNLDPGTVNCPVVAGVRAVSALSDRHREALYGSINESLDHYISNYNGNTMASWPDVLREKGVEPVSFGEGEIEAFRERVALPTAEQWITDNTALGLPAQDIYELVKISLAGGNPEFVRAEQKSRTTGTDNSVELVPGLVEETNLEEKKTGVASSLPLPETAMQATAISPLGEENYFGRPRDGETYHLGQDPLTYVVEWELQSDVSVGSVLLEVANYIGYSLVTDKNAMVSASYRRPVPDALKSVSGVKVGNAFEMLSGQGFITLVDHVGRTVKHRPKKGATQAVLEDCPADIGIASEVAPGILRLQNGVECKY